MANCHNLFEKFDKDELAIPKNKLSDLMKSRDALRTRILDHFAEQHPDYKPTFFIQGSYKMKTMIRTEEDTCDLDDGIRFLQEPDVSGTTLQTWVRDAVDGQTSTPSVHKTKCIRVIYAAEYHIDLPVYYKLNNESPHLAVKNSDWEDSDPEEFIKWFQRKADDGPQLRRIVRYLKAWCDHKTNGSPKMPPGLVMAILAAKNMIYDDRDDVALANTLSAVNDILKSSFTCIMPSSPYDDLFAGYSDSRKNNFLTKLAAFSDEAQAAIDDASRYEASKKLRKHFGQRFPEAEEDQSQTEKQRVLQNLATSIVSGAIVTNPSGRIVSSSHGGVTHKPHRFYGNHEIS